jgi:hypothetical protein
MPGRQRSPRVIRRGAAGAGRATSRMPQSTPPPSTLRSRLLAHLPGRARADDDEYLRLNSRHWERSYSHMHACLLIEQVILLSGQEASHLRMHVSNLKLSALSSFAGSPEENLHPGIKAIRRQAASEK